MGLLTSFKQPTLEDNSCVPLTRIPFTIEFPKIISNLYHSKNDLDKVSDNFSFKINKKKG